MHETSLSRTPTPPVAEPPAWLFGPYRFDPANGVLSRDGEELYLPPRAASVLASLIRHADDVVSKDVLIAEVWGGTSVTDQSPSEAIGVIRDELGDDSHDPSYIQTVHRRGYRFIAPVTADPQEPSSGILYPPGAFVGTAPLTRGESSERRLHSEVGRRAAWGLAGVMLGIVITAITFSRAAMAPPTSLQVSVALRHPLIPSSPPGLAISPDGINIVYRAEVEDRDMLYLQSLASFEGRPMSGTEGGFGPFFSPDGKWIGFFRERRLFKVSLRGGAPVTLAGTVPGRVAGASWGPDGTIVFARGARAALWAVPADGGSPEQIASPNLENGEYGYLWPEILPDADTVIFSLELVGMAAGDDFRFGFTSLKTREVRFDEANGGGQARYLESGHLTFVRAGTLFAAPFDPAMATLTGPAEPIVDDLLMLDSRTAQLAVARSGSFAFVPGGNPNRHLSWISRDGSTEMVALDPGGYGRHRLSPGSRAIALEISGDIWIYDLERGASSRFTTHTADELTPLWNPDGTTIVFGSNRLGPHDIYEKPVDGSRPETLLVRTDYPKLPDSWSPDGEWLAYTEVHAVTGLDIWLLSLSDGNDPQPLVRSRFDESQAAFSPDGRWIAYVSDEPGQFEVVVRPFPGPGPKLKVSSGGGSSPAWSSSGDEIFFNEGDWILGAKVRSTNPIAFGPPHEIVRVPNITSFFAVGPGGQRFLVGVGSVTNRPDRIHLVTNATALLPPRQGGR